MSLSQDMLERELHGIELELKIKREQHRIVTSEIEQLESEQVRIRQEIVRDRYG